MANLVTRYNLLYFHYQALLKSAWLRRWDVLEIRTKSATVVNHNAKLYLPLKHSYWQYAVTTVDHTPEEEQEGQRGRRAGRTRARVWNGKPPIIQQAFTLRKGTDKDILGTWIRSLERELHHPHLIGSTFEEYLQRRDYLNLSTLSDDNLLALLTDNGLNRTIYCCLELESHHTDASAIQHQVLGLFFLVGELHRAGPHRC